MFKPFRILLFPLVFFLLPLFGSSQTIFNLQSVQPNVKYDNIHVQKIEGDSHYTAFVIWIKHEVGLHYHANHTETIVVLAGKGKMTLGDTSFVIKKNSTFVIPKGTRHSVITKSKKPLKVLSIQYPMFDGTDRIMIKP